MGEAKRRRVAREAGGQTEEGGSDDAAMMAAAQKLGDHWLSMRANFARVEALAKGDWIDVNIPGPEGRSPMVLRITKSSKNRVSFQLFAVE
jgi:hypothetical protein